MLICDFAKMSMPANLHLAYQALARFEKEFGATPKPWDDVSEHDDRLLISVFTSRPKLRNSIKLQKNSILKIVKIH